MATLFALLPLLLFAALMIGARWSAGAAGAVGAATAAWLAMTAFGHGADGGNVTALLGPLLEAGFTALTILWIVFGALAIHEYQLRVGAVAVLGRWLGSFGRDPGMMALFVAWFFALFLEGAAGFGTPLAIAAPLLVGLGVAPVRAVLLVLVGHAAGVSFGAVGTPIMPLLDAGGHDPRTLSATIAAVHVLPGSALAAWMFCAARQPAGNDDVVPGAVNPAGRRPGWLSLLVALPLFFVPSVVLAWLTGPELPTLAGALIGLLAFAGFARLRQRAQGDDDHTAPSAATVLMGTLPYLLVIALVLLTRLVDPVRQVVRTVVIEWSFAADYGSSVAPLSHPGTLLLLGLALAAVARSRKPTDLGQALAAAARRLPRVAVALLSVLLMARLLVHAGMIDQLAIAAARLFGVAWLFVSPATGALGAFITGSATASNILFAGFQHATAGATGVLALLAAAGQGVGAAIGNIIAPHNLVVGAAAVGIVGAEGQLLRKTLPICAAYATVAGALLYVLQGFV